MLSSCNFDEPILHKKIKFDSYEELLNDLKLENDYKERISVSFDDLYTNYPMCDLRLDNAFETCYYKCGLDMTPTLNFDTKGVKVMRRRHVEIENLFDNYYIVFSFVNFRNWEECEYDVSTFYWKSVGGSIASTAFPFYDKFTFFWSYQLVDRNSDVVVNFGIYTNENNDSVFDMYKDNIEEKCKEIFK